MISSSDVSKLKRLAGQISTGKSQEEQQFYKTLIKIIDGLRQGVRDLERQIK